MSASYAAPVTAHRPLYARHPTNISRSTINVPSPDQIPASPSHTPATTRQAAKAHQRTRHRRRPHERGVARAQQHPVNCENNSRKRQLDYHEPPRHPDRGEYRSIVGE